MESSGRALGNTGELEQLARLAEAGVQAFVVHGNHDPLDGRISQTEALEGVTVFGADAERRIVEKDGRPIGPCSGFKERIYRDSSVKLYFNVCGKSIETTAKTEFQRHSRIGTTSETDWR